MMLCKMKGTNLYSTPITSWWLRRNIKKDLPYAGIATENKDIGFGQLINANLGIFEGTQSEGCYEITRD